MDNANVTTNTTDSWTSISTAVCEEDTPRVKLLCSFLGSIMPRPQDGILRYVGGETRIVSLPRDISFCELMSKMRELYDAVAVVKYQQPDEDLDALVSVVNDDDVINMMEEYEKLGSGDGFTRLRIFLFSHPDQDSPSPYVDGDDRESEKRYLDALNNLNDNSDIGRQQPDSLVLGPLDDFHLQEQFFNPISIDGSLHNQKNGDMLMPPYNLRHIVTPKKYSDVECQWSPAYYSPRHHVHHDLKPVPDFPNSPSSARYPAHLADSTDKSIDRHSEEYARPQLNHHPNYEPQPLYSDNVLWMPAGAISGNKVGFPGSFLHGPGVLEGNNVCDRCWMSLQRHPAHSDHSSLGNGLPQGGNVCADCRPNRETVMFNADGNVKTGVYAKQQNDACSTHSDNYSNESGLILQNHVSPYAHISAAARFNDYVVDGPVTNYPLGQANMDSHHVSSTYVYHQAGSEVGNEVFLDQAVAGHQTHFPTCEECLVMYSNVPYAYGAENVYPISHGHPHAQTLWRHVRNHVHSSPLDEASNTSSQVNNMLNPRFLVGTVEGGQSPTSGTDDKQTQAESYERISGLNGITGSEYPSAHALKLNVKHDLDTSALNSDLIASKMIEPKENGIKCSGRESVHVDKVVDLDVRNTPQIDQQTISNITSDVGFIEGIGIDETAVPVDANVPLDRLSFLPELIASVKKAALEEATDEVKARAEDNVGPTNYSLLLNEETVKESESVEETELDSDIENVNYCKIEPTKAEAEAFEKGLQTITNDDLEEIRELGSGTYGAVYHGKWKGSDVAIKRIKASCFAGRPSERERLIADFWKEALILSSLHHPNVVSFYGIVRDGPDGSLATVTEFMVNGSLKQFLQKKDRTIDRRKRLIIAMDAAFGMEYLHGKNIVHFDLKCENLLVNMRDPQRPICKIGDLGLSKVKQHTLVSGGVRGTLPWMAPELLSGKSHMVSEKIDVYSFGIVMWELLSGEEPYAGMHCASIIGGIVNNTLRPQIPTWCDPEWKTLMECCWASDPADRPSFSEISRRLRNMAGAINVK